MQFERRRASEADVPFLLSLRRETMHDHLMASGVAATDEMHLTRVMYRFENAEILSIEGRPAGLLKLRRTAGEWEIIQLQLSRQVQGLGLGRALLEELLADATAAGATVTLSVLKVNPARKLYARLGFEVTGEDAHELHMRWAA